MPTSFCNGMTYDKQLLQLLTEVGERGISVRSLAKHVYNMNCSLFSQPDYQEIHSYVQQFLLRNSKSEKSLIESTGQRGYYRLNVNNNVDARQLVLQFRNATDEKDENDEDDDMQKPSVDLSLDLFS